MFARPGVVVAGSGVDYPEQGAGGRREDGLLGHVPELPGRHADEAGRRRRAAREGAARLRLRRPLGGLSRPGDRDERALRRLDADAVDADDRALPRERARVGAAAEGEGRAPAAARVERALHGRRRRDVVARAGSGRGHRAREVLQRAGDPQGRAGARQPADAHVDARLPREARRRRRAARAARRRAGVPDAPRLGRPRRARARGGVVRGREAAGARGEAHRPRVPARLRRLVGLGLLQRAGARPRQARRRLCLALGARPVAVLGRRSPGALRPRSRRRADRPARQASGARSAPPRSRRTRSPRSRA